MQPFLHELVTALAAPTQALSARHGDIGAGVDTASPPSAHGVLHADVRVLSRCELFINGQRPEHIATTTGPGSATFTSVVRRFTPALELGPDPEVRLDRHRSVQPGRVTEEFALSSRHSRPAPVTLEVQLAADFASIERIKNGLAAEDHPVAHISDGEGRARWADEHFMVSISAPGADVRREAERVTLTWTGDIPAGGTLRFGFEVIITDSGGPVVASQGAVVRPNGWMEQLDGALSADHVLRPWLAQSLADIDALRMATAVMPNAPFYAAGSPWFLTLFGRDSIWTARLMLPLDLEVAAGTLRTLAGLQGTKVDPVTAEAPGKILHELRRTDNGPQHLPATYYGTIDATPLWISLLHDAWRAGLDKDLVAELIPNLQAALSWLADYGDADGDGFLEYIDESGRGLANQGWKDSGDSVRFADGRIAVGPVALCEVQGYAYEAAMSGAALLDEFGHPGADKWRIWATELADRFRAQFWCGEGDDRYPALALDGQKRRVDSVTSNIGHLIGTGILSPEEERLVARRVTASDLDSGLGLRTMSDRNAGFSPLSYHCGSVWPHDTAIVIRGLVNAGLGDHAHGLIEGLLQASIQFEQRFPELWSGEGLPVPYPAACRPQAWSAAAAVTVADALGVLTPG